MCGYSLYLLFSFVVFHVAFSQLDILMDLQKINLNVNNNNDNRQKDELCFNNLCKCNVLTLKPKKLDIICNTPLHEENFQGLDDYEPISHNISSFIIRNNQNLEHLPIELFAHIRYIDNLILENNSFSSIEIPNHVSYINKVVISKNENLINLKPSYGQDLFELELNNLGIEHLNVNWFNFSKSSALKSINLNFNYLEELPLETFRFINKTRRVSLKNNRLGSTFSQAPFVIYLKPYLEKLFVSNNKIKRLPAEFAAFKRLTHLDFSFNLIEFIHSENTFKNLKNLKHLNLANNRIRSMNSQIFKNKLLDLCILKLENNLLSEMPSIQGMDYLVSLNISNQSGNLQSLNAFQFNKLTLTHREDDDSDMLQLSISLKSNDFERISTKAFCSFTRFYFDLVELSPNTFLNLVKHSKCLIANQLVSNSSHSTTKTRILIDGGNGNVSNIKCDCDLYHMLNLYDLNIEGLNCEHDQLKIKCLNNPKNSETFCLTERNIVRYTCYNEKITVDHFDEFFSQANSSGNRANFGDFLYISFLYVFSFFV
jgi:hypothetical protein